MHFTTEQGDDKTVFRLKEPRLDSRNAGQLKAEFLILSQPDIDALIVDLTAVEHIDSAGISALLLAQRQMKIHDGEVRLVGLRPDVLSMLRLTQLDRIFAIFNTVEEALAAELMLPDDDDDLESDPGFRDSDFEHDDELELSLGARNLGPRTLGPSAPSANDIKAGAIAAGGSFGAAALSKIMMTPYDDELLTTNAIAEDDFDADGSASGGSASGGSASGGSASGAFLLGGLDAHSPILGDDEDFADDDDDLDDDLDDDDLDDDEDEAEDLDEEDDAEDVAEVAEEDIVEDEDFEDDDLDDEELDEDEDEDF